MTKPTCFLSFVFAVCAVSAGRAQTPVPKPDPSKDEVVLPAGTGWQASLVYESDVGIWTCGTCKAFPMYGCPEVFGLDDKGHCTILYSYSGKWTPYQTVEDREWLGAFSQIDLDASRTGLEMYTGGKPGNLYQIQMHPDGGFDANRIARFPAQEIHTLVGGDLLPSRAGTELLCFTLLGDVYDIRPRAGAAGEFDAVRIDQLMARVREALVLPAASGQTPWIAAACRSGDVMLLRLTQDGKLEKRVVVHEPMGFGRLALKHANAGEPHVLYVTRDDGVILRLEQKSDRDWQRDVIYDGPQGPRGIAAGRFNADPTVETVAVFGYSKRVELLSREKSGSWSVETVFEDRDKGHWLAAVELDGRNETDELLASGYGCRIILLSRPPGYGRASKIPVAPAKSATTRADADPAMRIGLRGTAAAVERLSPLSYRGGFEAKTWIYETLVKRDRDGRIAPALASAWRFAEDGKTLVLELRDGAQFHDGTAVDAAAVALQFKRWVGLPEHAWLGSSTRIREVQAISPREVVIRLNEPWDILADLCAINPCAIQAPSTLDREGNFVKPIGSGALALDEPASGGSLEFVGRVPGAPASARVTLFASAEEAARGFRAGTVDLIADGWYELVPRFELDAYTADRQVTFESVPGSSVCYLSFRMSAGPTANPSLRQRIAAAIDRDALVRDVELGHADSCAAWCSAKVWPAAKLTSVAAESPSGEARVRLLIRSGTTREERLGRALVLQLERCGVAVEIDARDAAAYERALRSGEFDLRIERTWGIPYDPDLSLANRFLPAPADASAAEDRCLGVDPEMTEIVRRLMHTPVEADRLPIYREIQDRIDATAVVVPLYVPRRLMLSRGAAASGARLDLDLYRLELARPVNNVQARSSS